LFFLVLLIFYVLEFFSGFFPANDAGFGERKELPAMLIFSSRKAGFPAGDAGRLHALRRRWGMGLLAVVCVLIFDLLF
jgi:hypothetical protein